MEKYKDTIYSRYFILREGLFKNTKKIINISRDYIMIENLDDKNYKELIRYEDIVSIKISDANLKDFKINYYLKDNDSRETSQAFTTNLRTQVVCDILKQLDLHTKVNHYPVETFKCFLFLEDSEEIIESFSNQGINVVNKNNNSNILDINLNIYRSIIEWVCYDSKRETRVRLSDIDHIKIYDLNNNNTIFFKIETFNKIDLFFLAKNTEEYRAIVDKICDNAKVFIGVDIIVEHLAVKEFIKPTVPSKMNIFSFNTYRILYNSSKRFVKLTGDYENIYENYENKDGIITKINKIPLNQIVYIISYENENEFFEIVLKSNARYLYQTLEQERNLIITSIIDLISFNNQEEQNFILLSNKPKYGLKVMGFIYDEVDWEYDRNICLSLLSPEMNNEIREKIVEDICLNFCFKSQKFKIDSIISNKKNISVFFQNIFDLLKKEGESLNTLSIEENKNEYYRKIYVINLYLILYKSLINKYHYDTVLTDLYGIIINTNFQTIFFNAISIFRLMIPNKGKYLKKDEIAQKKWIVSFHLENGAKIKTILYSKIFEKNLTYDSFENQNILSIYILLELLKNMYDFSKEINLLNEIIKEFNSYEFLYTLYMLLRCNSSIMIQISLEILIILLKNLSYEQEFSLKQIILKRSLIFLVLIKIYINNPNEIIESLTLRFLKSFIISHVEATNLLLNLFPATLFYYIDKNKPNPINWQDDEWEAFFNHLTKDFNSTQLIWNDHCRKELLDFLENIIQNYENFSQNFNIINSLKIGEVIDISNMQYRESFNPNFYCLNYKELKLEYQTLKKYYFVWKYYLKRIILEKGKPILQINIDKPKKFWKKIMEEIITTNSDWKVILLIKALTLLYKNYFTTIGPLKNLDYFVKIFSVRSFEIKSQLLQFFYVICDVEDNEIKTANITNFINIDGMQKLINFIPHLINIEYLESSLEKINYNDILLIDKSSDNPLEEGKEKNFKSNFKEEGCLNDKHHFINYCNYSKIHHSYDQADNNIKLCSILVKLIKTLDQAYSRHSDTDNKKIMFPIPKVKSILMDENNFAKMFIILFCKDENLCSEFLELIIYNMNDPLTYQKAISKTGLCDLLLIFLLKYKNPVILSYFEQISRFHNILFNFDEINNLFDEDEKEFTKVYSNSNRFLMKYFPINILYIYFSNDYNELMKIIFSENILSTSLIWNSSMLIALIECLNEKFKFFVKNKLKPYYLKIDFLKEFMFDDFPVYEFDETFRFKYKELDNKVKSFIYYLEYYISNKELRNENENNDTITSQNPSIKKYCSFSNNIFEDHVEIVMKILIQKINILKEQLLSKSEFYSDELKIYLKSILKLIDSNDFEIINFSEHFKEIINLFFTKDNISVNEEKIFKIILKVIYVSIANMEIKSIENLPISSSILDLLMKGVIFYFKKILHNDKEDNVENSIKIISSIIQIINRNPISVYNQYPQLIEHFYFLSKDFLYKKFLVYIFDKKPLPECNSLLGQFFICILELVYLFSKITTSCLLLIESGLILELILFALFYDREKKPHSEFINIISKKSVIIINSLISFAIKYKDDSIVNLQLRQTSKDFYDSILNLIGSQNLMILTKINMNVIKNSLSTTFEYEKELSYFLISLKSTYELPDFIWDKKIRKEVKVNLKILIEKTLDKNSNINYINQLKEMRLKSYENEFVIDNIYIKLYNKDPHWKIKECDSFLEKIKQVFIKLNDLNSDSISNFDIINKNIEMLFALSNCVTYSKANEKLLTNDKVFGERLNFILKTTSSRHLTYAIFNLLNIFSEKTNSMKFIMHKSMIIVFTHVINKDFSNETLEQIIKIIKNILKNDEFIEKLNLILILFLLKGVLEKDPKEESIRIEIFKILKKLYFNKIKSNMFSNLLKIFIPEKIIKNIFNEKEINLSWIDSIYEIPDMKWTKEERESMMIKIQECCQFFIKNESYIEGFPHNLLDSKIDELSHLKLSQNPISDEFKIDNIYIRIFNKDPSYNINKNLISFLKELADSSIKFFKSLIINKFIQENSNEFINDESNDINLMNIQKNVFLLKNHFIICFTAVLLTIEQINFNNFNENVIIGGDKNKVNDDKSIDVNIIKKILSFHQILTENFLSLFDNRTRLLYLEILYLLSYNKNGLTFISNLDIIKLLDKLVEDESAISDYEFIISLVLYLRLISFDMSSLESFLSNIFDKYVILSNKRLILLKYLQLVIARILKIDQYKMLVTEKFSKDNEIYKNYSLVLDVQTLEFDTQYLNIWRKPPLNKESVSNVFKLLHYQNFYEEDVIINNKITCIENKFPILPFSAITYINFTEINSSIENRFNLDKFQELNNHIKLFDDFLNIN